MQKVKQVFTLTKNPKIVKKEIKGTSAKSNVSSKMLSNEIIDLCNKGILLPGLKIDNRSQKKIIYSFISNKKSKLYYAHAIDSVKIIVNRSNYKANVKSIEILDGLTDSTKNLVSFKTSQDLFEVGIVQGFLVKGYSIGTYASPKLATGISDIDNQQYNPVDAMYNPDNFNNFIIFEDESNELMSGEVDKAKQYVLKND